MYITCRELIEFLDEYASGSMDAARRKKVDEHLAVCPDCVNYVESYRRTMRLVQMAFEEPEQGAPADVPGELVAVILKSRPSK